MSALSGESVGLGLAQMSASVLPPAISHAFGRVGARALYRFAPSVREALLDNARHILGPTATDAERAALARAVLASFARFALELLHAPRRLPTGPELFERMVGREHWEGALAAGHGLIGVTLHLGNYEAGPMLLTRLHRPVAIVFRRDPAAAFERVRSRQRRRCGIEEIPVDDLSRFELGMRMRDVLRRGGALLTAADVGFETDEGEERDFLGGRARFMTWPARVARATGAPLVPCFIVRDDGDRYHLEMTEPIFARDLPDDDAVMDRLLAVFETYVRRYPEQWLIIHRYWRD